MMALCARCQLTVQAAENPDSKVVVPIDNQKPLKSRFNDPDHPANSGSLISLVSGGAIATPGISGVIGRGRRTAANIAQGKGASEGGKPIKGPAASIVGKLVNQDVLYLMVVNVPTHQEMEEYVHQLDGVMHEAGYA